MEIQRFLEDGVMLADREDQRRILAQQLSGMEAARQDEFAQALKHHADLLMRTDTQQCLRVTRLLEALADISGNPLHRALGLLARANACSIVLGEYRQAADCIPGYRHLRRTGLPGRTGPGPDRERFYPGRSGAARRRPSQLPMGQ